MPPRAAQRKPMQFDGLQRVLLPTAAVAYCEACQGYAAYVTMRDCYGPDIHYYEPCNICRGKGYIVTETYQC